MKKLVAVPVSNGLLCPHFGHCEQFAVVEIDEKETLRIEYFNPPVHQPGAYPGFLAEKGVQTIIAGGLGNKAKQIFDQHNIDVYVGAGVEKPEKLVAMYLNGDLEHGMNLCDH